jgi:hypothetical protein|tara:strand:+ start:6451 stop:6792 length:342 start_codon:yes stop_codon:yes gene_type:complete
MKSIRYSWPVLNIERWLLHRWRSSEIKATPEETVCHFEYVTDQLIEACIDRFYWHYDNEVPTFDAVMEMIDEVLGFYPETETGKNILQSMKDNIDLEFIHEQVAMVLESRQDK